MILDFYPIYTFLWIFLFEIHHWSVKLKAENWLQHWAAISFCLELFSSAHQRSLPGGNRTRDLTVRKPVSNHCAISARSWLECSTSPITHIARIILHCPVCYTHIQRNGWPRNSRLPIRWSTYCRFCTSNELITQIFYFSIFYWIPTSLSWKMQ